jgi:AP-1 complex subunit beta-1
MVVANAVAALSEIQNGNGKDVFQINSQYLFKILRALNECTEWGQVNVLALPLLTSNPQLNHT